MIRVAVLVSTFNGEKYIKEQIDSLLSQDGVGVFIYVRDDGSSDGTVAVLQSYGAAINFVEAGSNLGVVGSFMRLLDVVGSQYDYYAFCDQDDVWLSDKIQRAACRLAECDNRIPLLYCSRLEYVDRYLGHLGYSRVPRGFDLGNALVENVVTGCTAVMNGAARNAILSRLPTHGVVMHDWWFYIVISALGTVLYDGRSGIKYRQHGGNVVGASSSIVSEYFRRVRRLIVRRRSGVRQIREQAATFLVSYGDILSEVDRAAVKKISLHPSWNVRFSLVTDKFYYRQRRIDSFFLKIVFLLGLY